MKSTSRVLYGIMNLFLAFFIVIIAGLGFLWAIGLIPASIDEALFRYRLRMFAHSNTVQTMISDLATFDWELVCSNHPYDEPLFLEKYGRWYEPPVEGSKAVWGLAFIQQDGSPKYITGNCRDRGARIHFKHAQCFNREVASLKFIGSGTCAEYEAIASDKER
jgi:hypothetical protein